MSQLNDDSATGSSTTAQSRWSIGPGLLVTAAFIGPGTVTSAMNAGFHFGLTLLWVVLLSTVGAIVLQEMAGRLGLVLRKPLGQILREAAPNRALKLSLTGLIFLAILFGNTAYQSGNLLGAVKGVDLVLGGDTLAGKIALIGVLSTFALIAAGLLLAGNPKLVSRFLIGLVVLMSLLFLVLAWQVLPPLSKLPQAFVPRVPKDGAPTTLALFGTTIVPYNLFLYASLVCTKWSEKVPVRSAIGQSRLDIVFAVSLGGLITAAILITGAAVQGTAETLDFKEVPGLLGNASAAQLILGLGLAGAGLTSAVTAPLAASYAAAGIFGWSDDLQTNQSRWVWGIVLGLGWLVALVGIIWEVKPQQAILLAQAANGLILPVLALLLWWLVTRRGLLGEFANGTWAKLGSFLVVAAISIAWLVSVTIKLWPVGE